MNNRASTWFPVALLLLLAALTYWLQVTVNERGPARERGPDTSPDFIIDNMRVTRTNQAGLPDYVLTGRRMQHFRSNDITQVEQPALTHYAPGAPPVHLTAERGEATGNGDQYEFFDNVVVTRDASAGNAKLTMNTAYLKVLPERALASTDRAVTITQGESVLNGIGMDLDNNTRVLHLLNQVRGTFHRAVAKSAKVAAK
jgi:lipopolysaccharide export system protein LptC